MCRAIGVVPFLTCKHPMDYCLAYADRAHQHGFDALVVLGGDKHVGPPRCVEHAWQLRNEIRSAPRRWHSAAGRIRTPIPRRRSASARRACERRVLPDADRLASRARRWRSSWTRKSGAARDRRGCFGCSTTVSANPRTLDVLKQLPSCSRRRAEGEFGAGATPEEVCARSMRALADAGARHFYISNLPLARAAATLRKIVELAGTDAADALSLRVPGELR